MWVYILNLNKKIQFFCIILAIFGFLALCNSVKAVEVFDCRYVAEVYATFSKPGIGATRVMTFAGDDNLYVVQKSNGSIWRITSEDTATEFVSGLNKPAGITWTGGTSYGDYLYVGTHVSVVKIALDGTISAFSGLGEISGVAMDRTGNYGGYLYATTAGTDSIYRVSGSGSASMFSTFRGVGSGGGPAGIVFDTIGDYNGLMYVPAAFGGTTTRGGLFTVGTTGVTTRFTNELVKAYRIDLDRIGDFGGHLFVVAAPEFGQPGALYRVTADGATTAFTSWISDLALGPDGSMYVSEYEAESETVIISRISRGYYVDDDAHNDPCHGVPGAFVGEPGLSDPKEKGSLFHPYDSIQKALDNINQRSCTCGCPTIIVLDGVYTGIGNYDINTLGLAVKIKSQNGPKNCIIDCNSLGKGFIIQNGEGLDTVIDGFTIIEGYADECAGAIDCNNGSPTINNCIIEGNYASWSGGAIFCQDSDAEITNCTITDNFCEASGAGICGVRGFPVIKNCLITNNDGYFSGGASSVYDCNMTIINCTIADNVASHPYLSTGGVYCWQGDANIVNTIVWNNNSPGSEQIEFFMDNEVCKVSYSDIQIGDSNLVWEGTGNLNDDPCFAAPKFGDYHLKSTAGRWAQILDPAADLNNDDIVNQLDLGIFVENWLYTGEEIYLDLYRYESIDFKDFAVLASNWLEDGLLDADFDDNNFVDLADLGIFAEYWLDTGREIPVDLYYEASIDFKDYAVLALDWLHPGWTYSDTETSPCIDAGGPAYDYTLEPESNGDRINMGVYGNTKFASKSPYSEGE